MGVDNGEVTVRVIGFEGSSVSVEIDAARRALVRAREAAEVEGVGKPLAEIASAQPRERRKLVMAVSAAAAEGC